MTKKLELEKNWKGINSLAQEVQNSEQVTNYLKIRMDKREVKDLMKQQKPLK